MEISNIEMPLRMPELLAVPGQINHSWSMDFQSDE